MFGSAWPQFCHGGSGFALAGVWVVQVGAGFMAFAVKTGVEPSDKFGRRPGRRAVPATLLAGLGAATLFGVFATVMTLHGALLSRTAGSIAVSHGPMPTASPGSLIALAPARAFVPEKPKYPRVPQLTPTPWQAAGLEEGAAIGPSGDVSFISSPKSRPVAQAPLAVEAFGARASGIELLAQEDFSERMAGLDTMQVASVQTYSTFDAESVVAVPSVAAAVAALEDAPPPVGTLPQGPFSLVLAEADPSLDDEASTEIPLPGMRPSRPSLKRAPQVLAYAPPDNDIRDIAPTYEPPAPQLSARNRTAIYSIEAKTVYLPNGEKLEAHSGLGPMLDNPRFVHKKMRGATPPHTYRLTMREKLFHGVEAIRLNPVEPGKIFGRDGLLAHTYMLGPRGDSNGCVSIKDYRRFLAAFKRGEIMQLVVVARMPSSSLFASR